MQYLNGFIGLLAKTESRDKLLRIVQYATLHSEDLKEKGPAGNIYQQMRRTRKILRFLRTIEYSAAIRRDVGTLSKCPSAPSLVLKIFTILENLFTLLFFLCDHRVFLGEMELISKDAVVTYYPRSMKMYLLQNVMGVLRNISQILVMFLQGKYEGEMVDGEKGLKIVKSKGVDIIKNILDIFVALYYLRKPQGQARRIGVIGVITSLIGVAQSLKLI